MAFATQRFAQNGFHPTSVAEITEGMGVGKGVFYWNLLTIWPRSLLRNETLVERHAVNRPPVP